jgi:hypothetical protein
MGGAASASSLGSVRGRESRSTAELPTWHGVVGGGVMAKQRDKERAAKSVDPSMVDVRNRVVGLRTVRAGDLVPNPKNWRTHPEAQREVMRGLLREVGYVDALIARETPRGLELVDGHLRSDLTPDAKVPVLVVDLNDGEVDKVLATLDPITTLAAQDDKLLGELLAKVETEDASVRRLLTDLEGTIELPDDDEPAGELSDDDARRDVPGMQLEPHEHYDYLVVLASSTHDWNVLCERLGLKPVERRGRMGTARAIRAESLLAILGDAPS